MGNQPLDFKTAFKYPFNRWEGLLNILWVLVPIVGWLVLIGYGVRICKEFIRGKFEKLPTLDFAGDIELGFFMFLKSLPFLIAYGVLMEILRNLTGSAYADGLGMVDLLDTLIAIFCFPMLFMNFIKKETIESLFEFRVLRPVVDNLGDYLMMLLKTLGIVVIFALMSVVLIGIPALAFTRSAFLADFYRRRIG